MSACGTLRPFGIALGRANSGLLLGFLPTPERNSLFGEAGRSSFSVRSSTRGDGSQPGSGRPVRPLSFFEIDVGRPKPPERLQCLRSDRPTSEDRLAGSNLRPNLSMPQRATLVSTDLPTRRVLSPARGLFAAATIMDGSAPRYRCSPQLRRNQQGTRAARYRVGPLGGQKLPRSPCGQGAERVASGSFRIEVR